MFLPLHHDVLVCFQYLFPYVFRARVRADEGSLEHVDVHSLVLYFVGNKTETEVDEVQITNVRA